MTTQAPAQPGRNRTGRILVIAIAIAVVAVLLATALVGGEIYARRSVSGCISSQFEREMGSKIDVRFGTKPLLITWLDHKVGEATVDTADSKFGPAVGMAVHANFRDIELSGGAQGGGVIGSSSAHVTWNNDGIRQTLGGLVSGVRSSAADGRLTLDVLGGLAQLQVRPEIRNGAVQVDTTSARLLGIGVPTELVAGIVDVFTKSLQSYPLGLQATEVRVTDDGIVAELAGGRTDLTPAPSGTQTTAQAGIQAGC
ncbi:DUF2993 domain-containing protein [Nocardia panacis]|uniref:DUF2993 domain-containing protein n=1 Tax=Nocardia panacis TaxID=2340916 RepID=A0A3A4K9V6_9NOCA|nr:DUF2993 domain-containing protein [Nocardia panacis]RJO76580.1 DUF2993 domain-containing protein [Nocardia panacis]